MLSCKETSELVSRSMDERLPWRRRLALRMHLAMCSACRSFDRQAHFLRDACGQLGREGAPDEPRDKPSDPSRS